MTRKQPQRFPRLKLTPRMKRVERILWHTYNRSSKTRSLRKSWQGGIGYDIYRTKRGHAAKIDFLILAKKLTRKKVDPSLYIHIMMNYGKFRNARWMPPTGWLVKDETLDKFEWLLKRERKKYHGTRQLKNYLIGAKGMDEDDIENSIGLSWDVVGTLMQNLQVSEGEATLVMQEQLSPWFLALNVSYLKLGGESLWPQDSPQRRKLHQCLCILVQQKSFCLRLIKIYRRERSIRLESRFM